MDCKIDRIKRLVEELNIYRDEYYNKSNSSVSDVEYDKMFDELVSLEKRTGFYMSNSPTQTVGYEVKSELKKVAHSHPMLSLDKTKSEEDIVKFINKDRSIAMLKMDGLTISLTYRNGELVAAETRDNGEIGEDVFHNAKVFTNIPLRIDYKDELVVDGEAIIDYDTFEQINKSLPENEKYANPRNLASGSVRQLDSSIAARRGIKFVAWKLVKGYDGMNSLSYQLKNLEKLGFTIVPYCMVYGYNPESEVSNIIAILKRNAEILRYPIDGLVWAYDDTIYGESLGMTGHHPRHSIAFKFEDDLYETVLRDIIWTMGKTGQLTPVAVFDPVEIDGTEVEKASLHNISVMENLLGDIPYKGQVIRVYKANMIIPQIFDSVKLESLGSNIEFASDGYFRVDGEKVYDEICIPDICPICGDLVHIKKDNETEVLVCTNDSCKGKLLGKLSHFVSKNALNIDGISESTLQFLIDKRWVHDFQGLYVIKNNKEVYNEWINSSGFGKKSVDKILAAIENSRNTTLERFIYAQSIPLIGNSVSKDISKYCKGDINKFCEIMSSGAAREFLLIDGFGNEMYKSLIKWYNTYWSDFGELKREFIFPDTKENNKTELLKGMTFVITGSLSHFKNREELVSFIENRGGKVAGSVSAKTSYLINNDVNSTSSKNVKARSLGVPIVGEEDFLNKIISE